MVLQFTLSPQTYKIIKGRMCKDGKELLCTSNKCKFDKNLIEVKGFIICSDCEKQGREIKVEYDNVKGEFKTCPICHTSFNINDKKAVWTQEAISKRTGKGNVYMHKECWDALFIDV